VGPRQLTQEQITLVLGTTSAQSYGFILPNVGTGTHTVLVQAQVNTGSTSSGGGVAVSNAMLGLGSLTVESVRLVNSFSF
jgi:pantothenate kinase